MFKVIATIGDPIKDIYVDLNKDQTESYEERPGGALNTYKNIQAILPNCNDDYFYPYSNAIKSYYSILRINNEKMIHLCPYSQKKDYYKDLFDVRFFISSLNSLSLKDSVLVLSDYNKGVLNTPINVPFSKIFKIAIVDSKHRSLDKTYLSLSDLNIWRCTGKEYDLDFGSNFDYVVWTNGSEEIKLLNKDQQVLSVYQPDNTVQVIDTCGAGDTFTAALAAYLYKNEFSIYVLHKAIQFAIECAADVVQKDRTSICEIELY